MTEIKAFADKDSFLKVTINMIHLFKEVEENMNIREEKNESYNKEPTGNLEMKTTKFEIKKYHILVARG